MDKIRFQNTILNGNGDWNGDTLPDEAPVFTFNGGFWEATLPHGVGRLPAELYGKAPARDPYVMLVTMWTDRDPTTADIVGVETNAPVRTRESWSAAPGNYRAVLVRPDDTITFAQETTRNAWLEILLEPLANTNEFGEVLLKLAAGTASAEALQVAQAAQALAEGAVQKSDPQILATFHVALDGSNPNEFTLIPDFDGTVTSLHAVLGGAAIAGAFAETTLIIAGLGVPGSTLNFPLASAAGFTVSAQVEGAFAAGELVVFLVGGGNTASSFASITLHGTRSA